MRHWYLFIPGLALVMVLVSLNGVLGTPRGLRTPEPLSETTLVESPPEVDLPADPVSCPGLADLLRPRISRIASRAVRFRSQESRRIYKDLRRFYENREYEPAWILGSGEFPMAANLLEKIRRGTEHGLNPEHYPVAEIESTLGRQSETDPSALVETDIILSHLFLTFASHLSRGRVNPKELETPWHLKRESKDLAAALEEGLATADIEQVLDDLAPKTTAYLALGQALQKLREESAEGWPQVGDTLATNRGFSLHEVSRYLKAVGDLPLGPDPVSLHRDSVLIEGVRVFQTRQGLDPDGIIGPMTLAEMQISVKQRVQTLIVNMERHRWIPEDMGSHVLVNVPKFELEVRNGETAAMKMQVITGTKRTPTPVFADQIEFMEINPQWHVPRSIATEEILPKILEDPGYLTAKNFTVLDVSTGMVIHPDSVTWAEVDSSNSSYRFRQEPGGGNPLGAIKFLFPNPFSVYLHDTSNPQLFDRTERAFSHGCVRIEKPMSFAEFLMQEDPKWSREQIETVAQSGKRRWVKLPSPVPVYLVYLTAGIEAEGKIGFRRDIYGRDATLADALNEYRSPYQTPPPPPEPDQELANSGIE